MLSFRYQHRNSKIKCGHHTLLLDNYQMAQSLVSEMLPYTSATPKNMFEKVHQQLFVIQFS